MCRWAVLPGPTILLSCLTYGGHKTLSKTVTMGTFPSEAFLKQCYRCWRIHCPWSQQAFPVLERAASTQRTFKPGCKGFEYKYLLGMQVNDTGHRWGVGCYDALRSHSACKSHATLLSMPLICSTEDPEAARKGISCLSFLYWELPFSSKLRSGQGHS